MLLILSPEYWLKLTNEVIVIVGVSVFLSILWMQRDRVMLALTGDTVLHVTFLDSVWWTFFKCCGTCTGGWTRCFTRCPCCPDRFRNVNLVKALGRYLGISSRHVEVRNIVVGDLPSASRGDFYVTVRCQHNPDMVTSLAEDQNPKVVHFPEVLTLKMRESWLEERVVIKVMRLEMVGSKELCSVHISAMRIMEWANGLDSEKVKRFELKPTSASMEVSTPPWILVEFDNAADVRHLDELHNNKDTVIMSTTTHGVAEGRRTRQTEADRRYNMVDMKEAFPLLDNTGSMVQEPFEADLQFIDGLRHQVMACFKFCNALVIFIVVTYCAFRYYVYSCYKQYRWLEIAEQHEADFPISTHELMTIVRACHKDMEGTGVDEGDSRCRPSDEQIEAMCPNMPAGQPHPTAFGHLLMYYFSVHVEGVKCFDGLCQFRNQLTEWDRTTVVSGLALIFGSWFARVAGNWCIRRRRHFLNSKRAKQMRETMSDTD